MHDAGYTVKGRYFCLSDISVSFKDDGVSIPSDDSVDEDVAFEVTYKGYCASADVAVSPWAEGDLVPQMK